MPRTVAHVLIVACLATACNRHRDADDGGSAEAGAEGALTASGAGAQDPTAQPAQAEAAEPPPPPIVASRPDALLPAAPASTRGLLVDAAAVRAWAQARGWAADGDRDNIAAWLGEATSALVELPAAAADHGGVTFPPGVASAMLAFHGGTWTVAADRAPAAPGLEARELAGAWVLSPTPAAPGAAAPPSDHGQAAPAAGNGPGAPDPTAAAGGASPTAASSATSPTPAASAASSVDAKRLLDALPHNAMLTAWITDLADPAVAESVAFIAAAGGRAMGLAVGTRGDLRILIVAADANRIIEALGRGQAFVSMALGQLSGEASPSTAGWVAYANRATQALFGRVEVTSDGDLVSLYVPPPTCGGAERNLIAAAFVLSAANWASNDPRVPARPYVPMRGDIAGDCAPLPGPAARVSGGLLALSAGSADRSVVVVADVAGLLRTGLPTAFGLLPFALSQGAIDTSFGRTPMGLTGLDDADAQMAFLFERGDREGAPPHMAFVLPSRMAALLPEGGIDQMVRVDVAGPFAAFASPAVDISGRLGAATAGASPGADVAGALLVVRASESFVDRWASRVGATHPFAETLRRATALELRLSAAGRLTLVLQGAAAGGAAAETGGLASAIARIGGSDALAAQREAAVAAALDGASSRADGADWIVEAPVFRLQTLAAAIRVGLPLFAGMSGRGRIAFPSGATVPQRLGAPQPSAPGSTGLPSATTP